MKKNKPLFDTVIIIGLGLIGGSLALELKKRGLAKRVVGVARSSANRREALRRRAVDEAVPAPGEFIRGADLVVLATPVAAILKLLSELKPFLSERSLLTDVGSTKQSIVQEARRLRLSQFLGGHPIAGTEKSGMKAAELDLFRGKKWILTPAGKPSGLTRMKKLLKAIGAEVLEMGAREHDQALSYVSHLPNLLAYALAGVESESAARNLRLAGSSLKGMTRVASSPPEMWRDICLNNSAEISKRLSSLQKRIARFQKSLASKKSQDLMRLFEEGRRFRLALEKAL